MLSVTDVFHEDCSLVASKRVPPIPSGRSPAGWSRYSAARAECYVLASVSDHPNPIGRSILVW